jgi:Initiator Replication protein
VVAFLRIQRENNELAAYYDRMGLPRRDVSAFGYVRWPRSLAEADIPAEWKAIHLKLVLFLAHKVDPNNPWGRNSLNWKEAREFPGGGRKIDIQSALDQLMLGWITSKTPVDALNGGGGDESYSVLERMSSGIDGQEMFWTMQREFVADLADCRDGYGRVHLNVIRRLESFAALRLYLWAVMTRDAHKNPLTEAWEPARLAVFLGVDPGIRIDHFKSRVIEPAVAEVNAAASFPLYSHYTRETNTHGRAITGIQFTISPAGFPDTKRKATKRKVKMRVVA